MPIPKFISYPMPVEPSPPANAVDWQADPDRAVLLLHDMQSYFLRPFHPNESPLRELIANVVRLRERAIELGMQVVYSRQPGGMSTEERGLLHDFWGSGMSKSDSDVQITQEVRPGARDFVLPKSRYSAFVRSGLGRLTRGLGRDQLIICGVYAHVGCLMTAVDAFTRDIQPFFVADAVADFSAEDHRLALDYAARRCAMVVSTDRLCAMLDARRDAAPIKKNVR